ncbi:amino acid/amide ABC transporter membrane protein 2, HAAT family [Tistlia consotensis]|uniref:Amino acid/amide ABC transporter membrane protein 2, HAAT family n=1 Tax=Tistlia consotensis USBA 355 TaxID=560819 RepID=A0A1Y6CH40_9PROT|nr:branched-chain amino acid ABC transporter permease [Tistlia consotensis]SMF55011.1 amino acid/amide ABC transporter membrane protein 2, HAAT family [Tistlia consotensis USBA 355]SNR87540.1 amino acid/amide ABC transporter membrane protein 2, HAAT family [Tistlia consotensis]
MASISDDRARAAAPGAAVERAPLRLPKGWAYLPLALVLLTFPLYANGFWIVQIGAYSMILGIIALSLMFLAGYGGMVSLAQMSVAGCAAYFFAILGHSSAEAISLGWSAWLTLPLSLLIATAFATMIGLLASRTAGIYTIMITLAIAVAFFYFTRQNYDLFNGFNGFAQVEPPHFFGLDWRQPLPFFYLTLVVSALCYAAVVYLRRSTFGLTVQALRDNQRRMRALGYHVTGHQVAAYAASGFMAALGGLLLVWLNTRISPGTIGVGPVIDILIIAVLGGLRHPIGPFVGALAFVLLDNFAIDLIDRERFNTVIGLCFLAVVLFSPDGLLGLWEEARAALTRERRPRD